MVWLTTFRGYRILRRYIQTTITQRIHNEAVDRLIDLAHSSTRSAMQFFKYALVFAICFALLDPTDGGWLRKAWRGVKKGARNVVKAVKKVGCKVLFGIGCPAAVTAGGVAISAYTSGVGDLIVGGAVAAGKNACRVRKDKCKRSVSNEEIVYPFSDVFSDYDVNGDKEITYDEFAITVMTSVNLAHPEELMEPFLWSDVDGNEKLDMDEFMGAPLLFAHPNYTTYDDNATSAAA